MNQKTVKQKRILMLLENESFPEDSRVWLQSQSLVDAGYRVAVICPTSRRYPKIYELVGGVDTYRYPRPLEIDGLLGYVLEFGYSFVMQFIFSLFVFFRRGFDAIHMHTPPDFNAIIPACFKLFGKRFIYDLHDLSPELFQAQRNGQGNRWIYRLLMLSEWFACRRANLLIATNETQRRIQIDRGGASEENCFTVRNGPNDAFFQVTEPAHDIVKPGFITIGYVGMIGVQDGVDYLIRAVDFLVNRLNRKNIQVVIVGNGPALEELKSLVNSLNLSEFFRFTGFIPFCDVPKHIAAFDICSTPDPSNSYNDSCTTIKTMEYMALGKPVVCFETKENIRTAGSAALYATKNDISEYAAKIEMLMDDLELRAKLGAEGRRRIDQGLAWNHQARVLVSAYEHLFYPEAIDLNSTHPAHETTSSSTFAASPPELDSGRIAS